MKGNWPLYTVWFIILTSTVVITIFYGAGSSSFYGIAETREIVVNVENAVEIRKINVTEGQSVEKGSLLVELNSPDLMLKINHISHQLDQLKARKGVNTSEILSRLRQLKAEKAARENEIENQIAQLENQYKINKSLLSDLKSIPGRNASEVYGSNSPIELKIRSLKKELRLSVNPLEIQIELLQETLANSENPIKIQVQQLEKELKFLKEENSKLNIYSQISGIIGSVNFKPGENVSPFAPILTLHTKTPSYIKGYIYENAYSEIVMNECVNVASLATANNTITGCVVGIGGRIVEYPVRLRKHPDIQIWGREVVIRIPADNHFILGEKVLISSSEKQTDVAGRLKNLFAPSESIADVMTANRAVSEEKNVRSVVPLETNGIEASGILYLEDMDSYLVISDDTPGNAPILFLMNRDGRITEETVIAGLDRISDMESVAEGENGTVYIASSLSTGKKGRVKPSAKLLVSVRRQRNRFTLIEKIDLYALLKSRAEKESGADWASFILQGIAGNKLDIEGMFHKDGALFLGFKTPLMNKQSVIIRINDIDHLMEHREAVSGQISIWKTISLKYGNDRGRQRISDLFYYKDDLYITGTPSAEKAGSRSGSLWKLDAESDAAIHITDFNNLQPEGIAACKDKNALTICFDQGRNNQSKLCDAEVNK